MSQKVIVPIVEGEGEVEAVPLLLRRWLESKQRYDIKIARAHTARSRNNITKSNGLEIRLRNALGDSAGYNGILVLVDTDDDCAKTLVNELAKRATELGVPVPVVIICATREYEAWFLASLENFAGQTIKGIAFPDDAHYMSEVEDKRDAKGVLESFFPKGRIYKETTDQPAFTHYIDFDRAQQRSRSFRRLLHALDELLTAVDSDDPTVVTPVPS